MCVIYEAEISLGKLNGKLVLGPLPAFANWRRGDIQLCDNYQPVNISSYPTYALPRASFNSIYKLYPIFLRQSVNLLTGQLVYQPSFNYLPSQGHPKVILRSS